MEGQKWVNYTTIVHVVQLWRVAALLSGRSERGSDTELKYV